MLIGFIARGMQSKKIRQFEKQLAENIKLTHNRIWNGVSKDVGYLRRILNEIYIMRVRVRIFITHPCSSSNLFQSIRDLIFKHVIMMLNRCVCFHF